MNSSARRVVLTLVLAAAFTNATTRCPHLSSLAGATNERPSYILCAEDSSDEVATSSEEANALSELMTRDTVHDPSTEAQQFEDGLGQSSFLRKLRTEGHKFMRFGREPDHMFMRFGREPSHKFVRFGREPDHKFMRFGRDPDHKFMRFGRETDRNFMRNQREPQHNFMRFGRSVDAEDDLAQLIQFKDDEQKFRRVDRQPDHKFMRFGRQPDHKFMRFGRRDEFTLPNVNNIISSNVHETDNDSLSKLNQESSQEKQNV